MTLKELLLEQNPFRFKKMKEPKKLKKQKKFKKFKKFEKFKMPKKEYDVEKFPDSFFNY